VKPEDQGRVGTGKLFSIHFTTWAGFGSIALDGPDRNMHALIHTCVGTCVPCFSDKSLRPEIQGELSHLSWKVHVPKPPMELSVSRRKVEILKKGKDFSLLSETD